ncbi:MAG: PRC-barrel domain-containing protein [Acetobacteraceae bacterium]
MRRRLRAAMFGTATLLVVGGAAAQTPATPTPATPTPATPTPAAPAPAAPAPAEANAPAKPNPPPADKFRAKTGELRAAVLIGATVVNDQKQAIGTLSDILLDQNHKVTSAVLSVGGFLGVGSRLVVVPFASLHIEPDRIVLPGATKVSLENLSAYQAGG